MFKLPLEQFSIKSPAKVNLALRIKGQRADCYHLLEMINTTVGFGDILRFTLEPASQIEIRIVGNGLIEELKDPEKNLAALAAKLFLSHYGLTAKVTIEIEKEIPLGSGLGGASSNAAATLRALSSALELAMPFGDVELAHKLGADVPYCLKGGLACVTGIGEEVAPLPEAGVAGVPICLILPGFSVNTAEIFAEVRKQAGASTVSGELDLLEKFSRCSQENLYQTVISEIGNDLTQFAAAKYPRLSQMLEQINSHDLIVAEMSGSGSTLFILPLSNQTPLKEFRGKVARIGNFDGSRIVFTQLLANS